MNTSEAIKKYVQLSDNSGVLKDFLDALLPAFERAYIQKQKPSIVTLFKVLVYFALRQSTLKDVPKTERIVFWPIQLHHCDFMMPVINHLKAEGKLSTVLVSRKDVYQKLKQNGIQPIRLKYSANCRNITSAIIFTFTIIRVIRLVRFTKNSYWKDAVFNAIQNLGKVENAIAAIKTITAKNPSNYHVIGYDLSVVGKAISRQCTNMHIPCGRIQNGAPNYLLSGYSEVIELFAWNELSKRAYLENGFQGKVHTVGNILLHKKLKSGPSEELLKWLSLQPTTAEHHCFVALSGPGHNTSEKGHKYTLKILQKIIDQCEDCRFFIKLHPKDNLRYYQGFEDKHNVIFTDLLEITQKPDALDVLLVSDTLITGASTVAIDALDLDKGVISIDPLRELEHFRFLCEENVLRMHGEQDISLAIRKLSKAVTKSSGSKLLNRKNPVDQIVRHILDFTKTEDLKILQ